MKLPVASYTMLSAFDNCPHKGFRMYIAKDLPKSDDAKRAGGRELHQAFQNFIQRGRTLPTEFLKYEYLVRSLADLSPFAELPLAVDKDGRACGFFDADVFARGYGDVVIIKDKTAVLFDWKTGKKREDPGELRLHGMMLKAAYPQLERILGYYVWLQLVDAKLRPLGEPHDVSDTHRTWSELERQMDEIEHMLSRNYFPKVPNPLCGWCDVLDCEHNKRQK